MGEIKIKEEDMEKIKELLRDKKEQESLRICPRCLLVLTANIIWEKTNCPNCKYHFCCTE